MKKNNQTINILLFINAFRNFLIEVMIRQRSERLSSVLGARLPGDNKPITFDTFGKRVFSSDLKGGVLALGKLRKNNQEGDVLISSENLSIDSFGPGHYEVFNETHLKDILSPEKYNSISSRSRNNNFRRAIAFVQAINHLNDTDPHFEYIVPGFDFLVFLNKNPKALHDLKLANGAGDYIALGDLFYFDKDSLCAGSVSVPLFKQTDLEPQMSYSVIHENKESWGSERVIAFDHFLYLRIPR